jgi:DNA-binding NarL/FixJ family response regulator
VSSLEPSRPTLLIADHSPTRLGVRIALDGAARVCAEADNAEQAIEAARREKPEVSLVGLDLPGGGIQATRGICRVAPRSAVIVLAAAPGLDDLLSCVHAGAVGCLPSDIGAIPLRRAVVGVRAGEAAVPRSMVLALVRELQDLVSNSDGLTAREIQVLGMLRRGHSTATIASELGISPVTVRRHVSAMVHKTGAVDRLALTRSTGVPRGSSSDRPRLAG